MLNRLLRRRRKHTPSAGGEAPVLPPAEPVWPLPYVAYGRSPEEIRQAMSGVLCRCFTNVRMLSAIERYARTLENLGAAR